MPLKTNMKYRLVLLVLLPLIIGCYIEGFMRLGITRNNQVYLQLASLLHVPWMYGGGMAIWFFVGRAFGNLSMNTMKSFILGNIAWGILISLYIWQLLLDITSRNPFLINTAHYYALGFLGSGVRIVTLFTNDIQVSIALLIAYLLMLVVFSLGFYSALKSKSSASNLSS
ncbi:hypothetical protein [Natronincola ferrireducens]|uniref:Uncharacterized protein n=1 Tax=Natronincola ferrireducens TaxID=393762 RepID=A0A1G9H038_9FIRM|nr:hypothetical protein [Natronincola ferrireducens]SDL06320.1 hypothetical protein SAMN05660472_02545 [Natronincola ferrireducens]